MSKPTECEVFSPIWYKGRTDSLFFSLTMPRMLPLRKLYKPPYILTFESAKTVLAFLYKSDWQSFVTEFNSHLIHDKSVRINWFIKPTGDVFMFIGSKFTGEPVPTRVFWTGKVVQIKSKHTFNHIVMGHKQTYETAKYIGLMNIASSL